MRVERFHYYDNKAQVFFPFDRFWLKETDAPAAERAYLAHSRPEHLNAYASLRIRGGDTAIEELFIAGQTLREYLRSER